MKHRLLIIPVLLLILAACNPAPESTVPYEELPESGDAANGEILFTTQACIACHTEDATGAPYLEGLVERAGTTVEGQSAREYIFYSIVEPAQHIVEGYGNAMPNNYDENMTPAEIADLIEYLNGL